MFLCMLQAFIEFLKVCHEPHLIATIGFVHEVSESTVPGDALRDVAKDHESPSIRHELLHDLTSKVGLELSDILLSILTHAFV